ncbi:MAG: hypothetical protein AAGC53_02020 [Actinomycetota bacterium]
MHDAPLDETDTPEPGADIDAGEPEAREPQLDEIAAAFDTVEAAMQAIDAEDLDQAEALAASLDGAVGDDDQGRPGHPESPTGEG